MIPQVREEVAIETPHISTEILYFVSSTYFVDVKKERERAACYTHSTELSEEHITLVSDRLDVCCHCDIRIDGLKLTHSLHCTLCGTT